MRFSTGRPLFSTLFLLTIIFVFASPGKTDWDPSQESKWVQFPDLTEMGIDVNTSYEFILADDFLCRETGPITGIHVWGSWREDYLPFGQDPHAVKFTLSIHRDIPVEHSPTGYSMPGELYWMKEFEPGTFQAQVWVDNINEGWMDPPDHYLFPGDHVCWQYNFEIDLSEAFVQEGTETDPIVYWLDVKAEPMDNEARFGWKTSPDHWNDNAVWGIGNEPFMGPWEELIYPVDHELHGQPIDLAFVIAGDDTPPPELDYGDAPDPTYPTLAASVGASHQISPNIYLGAGIDAEPDGQPDPTATGDDLGGFDDEDGVVPGTPLIPGQTATMIVTASVDGYLDGWIDFEGDGSWSQSMDQLFSTSLLINAGSNTVSFNVPNGALPDITTFARFRFSQNGGLTFTGAAGFGEVEDYSVRIEHEPQTYKWEQPPDLSPMGIDIHATLPFILADDFNCTETGHITTVHVWSSWLHDYLPFGEAPDQVKFTLSFHDDIPASQNPDGYSMPGEVLWVHTFEPGEFVVDPWATDIEEGYMFPPEEYIFPADWTCWLYTFNIPAVEAFFQHGTPDNPKVYWLDVQAVPYDPEARFGWKTSVDHWNDDAVWGMGEEPYFGPWSELIYPPGHEYQGESIDLAFRLEGEPASQERDFGDAPDQPYPTYLGNGGAFHWINPSVYMGTLIDSEPEGQPSSTAIGDDSGGVDDEDGVNFTSPINPGSDATVDVLVTTPGYLDAWIDFNLNGSWADPEDRIFSAEPLVSGMNSLTYEVPATGLEEILSFARFRFHTNNVVLDYTGGAVNGEVEDYMVQIQIDLSSVEGENSSEGYALHLNHPNPFKPETTIRYNVPSSGGSVTLEIFNVEGRQIQVLVSGEQTPGLHNVLWDGRDSDGHLVSPGIYTCRMSAPGFVRTRKMVLMK